MASPSASPTLTARTRPIPQVTFARRSREIGSTLSSVVERAGSYLAATAATRARPDAAERSGIYWAVSRDPVHWSPPALLWAAPLLWRRDCAAAAYTYPGPLDGDSAVAVRLEPVRGHVHYYIRRRAE